MKSILPLPSLRPVALAVMLAVAAGSVHADERESLEVLRQTTLNLISALVEAGVITREKAAELIRQAEEKAQFMVAQQREKERLPGETTAQAAPATPAASAPVRVQYIPESVKTEIRDQLRKEVMNQARDEHWADRNAVPSWLDRIKFSGDILTRYQFDNYASSNTAPRDYDQSGSSAVGMTTRNAAFASNGNTSGNTQNDLSSLKLRVRLGLEAKLSDEVRAEMRIASGNSDSRNSTTQTLGSNFNKYSLWLDRGFIRYDPLQWAGLQVGRMSNPFVTSDLIWDENVNLDGLALGFKDRLADGFVPYATIGAFPLATESEPKTPFSRTLYAAQIGASTDVSTKSRVRAGLAYYRFHNLEGHAEPTSAYNGSAAVTSTYLNSEYGSSMRQRGNTLVRINAANDLSLQSTWGLASKFAPLHIGTGLDYARTDALHFVVSADYVKNLAFDRAEIKRRTAADVTDGRATGYQLRFLAGAPSVRNKSEWNASVTFRNLGSDAVPDAFVDSNFGGGGTNVRGYILGFNYGLDKATVLGLKYLSGRTIDSPTMLNSSDSFRLNTWQLDLGVGF